MSVSDEYKDPAKDPRNKRPPTMAGRLRTLGNMMALKCLTGGELSLDTLDTAHHLCNDAANVVDALVAENTKLRDWVNRGPRTPTGESL